MTLERNRARRHEPPISIERRLARLLMLSVASLLLVAVLATGIGIARITRDFVVTRLSQDRDNLIASLQDGRSEQNTLPLSYHQVYSGFYYQIERPGSPALRSRSLWDAQLTLPELQPGQNWRGFQPGPDNQYLLVLVTGVLQDGVTVRVAVAEDISALRDTLTFIYSGTLLAGILLAGVLWLLQRRVLRTLLRPLLEVRADVTRLEHGELTQLPQAGVPIEILPLVNQVNHLLEIIGRRLTRSRRAIGDLAHALKTPLAALAQLEGEPAMRRDPQVAERLQRHVQRIGTLIDSQLRRARLAGGGAPGVSTPLREQINDLIATLGRIYRDKPIQCTVSIAQSTRFPGDREDLLELLGVVLDNAFKWSRGCVAIDAAPGPPLRLQVADDGPGVAVEDVARLTRRGQRLDESAPGSGLGLAIASDIVEQYGGRLDIVPHGRLGGLTVCITIPANRGVGAA
ncbi:MAG TPA: sensor histidine kinase [Nitrococcus sp.]|nr:sensor histidine kinase [Nitrococcus sp.]